MGGMVARTNRFFKNHATGQFLMRVSYRSTVPDSDDLTSPVQIVWCNLPDRRYGCGDRGVGIMRHIHPDMVGVDLHQLENGMADLPAYLETIGVGDLDSMGFLLLCDLC